ncbi:MAG: hypothetical protein JSR59_20385 [Proteobacteria bacterium]|nr:hypothetical protein [Pseudomonadota bacterium]
MQSELRPGARLGLRATAALALFAIGLVAGCGGGGPPAQVQPPRIEVDGLATDGDAVTTAPITVKGALGPPRTNAPTANPSQTFEVTTEALTPPYMASTSTGVSVAIANGRVNITPLTSLLVTALFGQEATQAFNDYGDSSPEQIALITADAVARAQADATDFLQNVVGVQVESGTSSFLTTTFAATAGDPMWDTLVALKARIAALGDERYASMLDSYTRQAHDCRLAEVDLTVGATTLRLCPASSTATPESGDPEVLDEAFTTSAGDSLTVRTRGDAVIDAGVVTAAGQRYTCSGSSCAGITLGTPAYDGTRDITFASVRFNGSASTATGTLRTAIPGIPLPILPCAQNDYHLISAYGVASSCADSSTALLVLAVTGTLSAEQGASTMADYIVNSDGTATMPGNFDVVLDGDRLVSVTAIVYSADYSTQTIAKCVGAGCHGVTIGPTSSNLNFGIRTDTRTIRFDGTPLATVDADGSLGHDVAVTIKASVKTIYYSEVDYEYATPPDTHLCDGLPNHVRLVPPDTPLWIYDLCPRATEDGSGSGWLVTSPLDGGAFDMSMVVNGSTVAVDIDADGHVVKVRASQRAGMWNVTENFGCDGSACNGVSVTPPATDGSRNVVFQGAVLHHVDYDGFASGPRTATMDGSFLAPSVDAGYVYVP